MPVLTPNDASILALIAQYPKRSVARRKQLELLLGAEGKRVAEAMFSKAASNGKAAKQNLAQPAAEKTADVLRKWARSNRFSDSRASKETLRKPGGTTYKIKMGDRRDWNIVVGERSSQRTGMDGRNSAIGSKIKRKASPAK